MNALTTLVLELNLPVFVLLIYGIYAFVQAKVTSNVVTPEATETLTFRQRARAKRITRVAA